MQKLINQIVFPKKTASLNQIRTFTSETARLAGCPKHDIKLIVLAVDAAASSIILNAIEQKLEGVLSIKIDINNTCFRVEIHDMGSVKSLDSISNKELEKLSNYSLTNDLGIFLIRRIMHEVDYEYKRGFINKLVLTRFIQ